MALFKINNSAHDPTADHNQQSHVPRVPLRASQTFGSERPDQYVDLIFLALSLVYANLGLNNQESMHARDQTNDYEHF